MKPRLFGWLSGLGLLLMLAVAAKAAGDDKGLIQSGKSIGRVHVGRDDEPLDKWFGEPGASEASMGGKGVETWYSKAEDGRFEELSIFYQYMDPDRKNPPRAEVRSIVVTSPFFHTPGGLSTRSDPAAFWREFPGLQYADAEPGLDGTKMEVYDSKDDGIAIYVERIASAAPGQPWGKCRAVLVHLAGQEIRLMSIGGKPEAKP